MPARIPLATYRLQFNAQFTFRDAAAVVDYLDALGVSDCYASSYLKSVPGSPHGYDVADPTALNPEIGTEAEYWSWIDALHAKRMGHLLDVVPNHMGIAKSSNPWWQDVLENGPSSRFAHFFDIEWHPVKDELADKLLIPILGDQYGASLERQELRLAYAEGAFAVHYGDVTLPIAPDTYGSIVDRGIDALDGQVPVEQLDELRSIITASQNLPPRTVRDPERIATRAREKEIVKRRLAALTVSSAAIEQHVNAAVSRLNGTAGDARSFDPLDDLLNAQSYRLAHWRVASEEINYRRFFDVNELAALRVEDPVVFDHVHQFVFELVARGAASGLRIDHVDGLFAPADYLRRLQRQAAVATSQATAPGERPFFIVVEKILTADEQPPANWPIHGTTGYEFGALVNRLFVDRRSERALSDIYGRFIHERRPQTTFDELAYRCKKLVLHETMSGDINSLGHQLNRFSERNRHYRDFTLYSLISTLKEVIACFPVYRTYVTDGDGVSDQDFRYIARAVRDAKRRATTIPSLIFDFIERLLLKTTAISSAAECDERARFAGKFQQITSPVTAKGIEDTALYVYNRLLSLNEVGSNPMQFGIEPSAAHEWLVERTRRWPHALSASSTHDTKRGEDVRARLNVLSEIPGAWKAAVSKWRGLNRRLKADVNGAPAPDANEEYLLYQTLVGAWPFESDGDAHARFRERMREYMLKALREAKVHTSWLNPNDAYEAAVGRFVDGVLDRRRANPFLQAFAPFQQRVAELGIYNSLAQLLIKVTAPGVPDFYQGTELWDLSLVDPDNRRPVDYVLRRRILDEIVGEPCVEDLLSRRADGRVKLFVTRRALGVRRQWLDVFERGEYVPLPTSGTRREHLFAFARVQADAVAITVVPRLVASVIPDASAPPVGAVWLDTRLDLTAVGRAIGGRTLRNAFTGEIVEPDAEATGPTLAAAALLARFPVALLTSHGG